MISFSQIYLLVTKVSLHPLVLIVTILERFYATLDCCIESLKVIFFLTSCQPNWTIIFPQAVMDYYSEFARTLIENNLYIPSCHVIKNQQPPISNL